MARWPIINQQFHFYDVHVGRAFPVFPCRQESGVLELDAVGVAGLATSDRRTSAELFLTRGAGGGGCPPPFSAGGLVVAVRLIDGDASQIVAVSAWRSTSFWSLSPLAGRQEPEGNVQTLSSWTWAAVAE